MLFTNMIVNIKPLNKIEIPEMYKSALMPFKTELPDPGQTANVLIGDSSELLTPIATWTVLIPVCFFTRSIESASVIGVVAESTWAMRPVPISLFSADGKMIRDSEWGKALASQSPIAPRVLSQDVCGEYNAMRFSKHTETNRVFHELNDANQMKWAEEKLKKSASTDFQEIRMFVS